MSLAAQEGLIFLDLHGNNLGGELGAFANALSGNGSSRLMHVDLSNNRFEGPIPEAFAESGILSTDAMVLLGG